VESRISQMHASVMQRLRIRLGPTCRQPLRKRKRLPRIPAQSIDGCLSEYAAL